MIKKALAKFLKKSGLEAKKSRYFYYLYPTSWAKNTASFCKDPNLLTLIVCSLKLPQLRPFELATFRLNNMNEIIQNWSDYILNEEYLPQRGASFLLNNKNQIIYKFCSNDVLGYSSNMRDPLGFLTDLIKE